MAKGKDGYRYSYTYYFIQSSDLEVIREIK